ncbi:hypothetical protein [Raineyella sp.]|uniref:hypothetical protein n=1 Tax=Raineyella sp. TaxID=1911550 RepID=UPI002B1EA556|nr:hypothetical protein [Raineyella sp.]MEA5154557.1 hypothetical protein [Raineyella sp.]
MTTTHPGVAVPLPDLEFFSADDVLTLGGDPRLLQRALRRGDVVRVCHRIYARSRPDDEVERHLQVLRACLSGPVSDGVVGGVTAALLHGLDPGPEVLPTRVTLLRPGAGACTQDYEVLATRLPASHICELDTTPVSSVARTVVDITRREPFGSLTGLVVVDSALRRCADPGALRAEIEQVLADLRGCTGLSRTRSVLREATSHAAGATETISRALLGRMGIPAPLLDVTFRWPPALDDAAPPFWTPQRTGDVEPGRPGTGAVTIPFSWPDTRLLGVVLDRSGERGIPTGWQGDRREWLRGPRRHLREIGWHLVEWSPEDLRDPWPLSQRLTTIMRELNGGFGPLSWSSLGRPISGGQRRASLPF